jgi:5'-3' exonuclease
VTAPEIVTAVPCANVVCELANVTEDEVNVTLFQFVTRLFASIVPRPVARS